ncbi:MAG: hypothetical protein LKE40_14585 [Spirochaetia bacterium]|nr:hypothetical protein [Spirochaetia bacterium]
MKNRTTFSSSLDGRCTSVSTDKQLLNPTLKISIIVNGIRTRTTDTDDSVRWMLFPSEVLWGTTHF